MIEAPAKYVGPAFVGWRCWRILPYESLGAAPSVRLSASGTRGRPKFWEPLKATSAVCGLFATTHDAPWPDCSCGLHAYRTEKEARAHLMSFVEGTSNGKDALGWAFGRVSLWGRIVEHEHGWRAEHAYPYELTVHGPHELAETVRRLYAVDVDQQDPFPELVEEQEEPASGGAVTLGSARTRLAAIRTELEAMEAQVGVAPRPRKAKAVPKSLSDVLHYDEHGNWLSRSDDGIDMFVAYELGRSTSEHDRPVGTGELVVDMIRRAGGPSLPEADRGDSSQLGQILHRCAMKGHVHRFKGPGWWTLWARTMHVDGIPDGVVESDPQLDHLETDVPFIVAARKAAGAEFSVAARAIVAELGDLPAQRWSGTFARCHMRGWIEPGDERRVWWLTSLGRAVARLGKLPPEWPGYQDIDDDRGVFINTLREAIAEAGRPVTIRDLEWRFRTNWGKRIPEGAAIRGRLDNLRRRGLVTTQPRVDGGLVRYALVEDDRDG